MCVCVCWIYLPFERFLVFSFFTIYHYSNHRLIHFITLHKREKTTTCHFSKETDLSTINQHTKIHTMKCEQIALDILHSDIFYVFAKMEICEHVCLIPNLLKSYSFIKNKTVLARYKQMDHNIYLFQAKVNENKFCR